MTRKRQIKAVKSSSKGKPKPAPVKPLVEPLESRDRPSWDDPEWEPKTDAFLWNEFEKRLATQKNTPNQNEELKKRYREKLSGWIERMVAMRSEMTGRWTMMPLPSQADRQAAEAECDKFIAFILAREIEEKDPETHRTTQASGRRGFKALTLQDAGYSLAAEIAGGDGQLEISLEALALWLQIFVEANGERVPRWRTMPASSFHHLQRKPHKRQRNGRTRTVVKNASEVRLKTTGEEWLWRELARSAFEDAETAKALHYLLGWHQGAALGFLQRFLAARHSSQDETRERLITTAAAMESGNKDRLAVTTKEDRQRIIKDHRPAPVITSAKSQSGKVGNPFRYQITTIIDPTSFAAEDLPRGLRIDLRTGLISGTPKVPGKFKVTIAATNAGGTGKARLNISISPTTKTA